MDVIDRAEPSTVLASSPFLPLPLGASVCSPGTCRALWAGRSRQRQSSVGLSRCFLGFTSGVHEQVGPPLRPQLQSWEWGRARLHEEPNAAAEDETHGAFIQRNPFCRCLPPLNHVLAYALPLSWCILNKQPLSSPGRACGVTRGRVHFEAGC